MLAANTYKIRFVTEQDADALRRLADLDSSAARRARPDRPDRRLPGRAPCRYDDDRVIADPFRRTDHLVACLRSRAGAMRAYEATPSLSERLRAALRPRAESHGTGSSGAGVRKGGSRLPEIPETPMPGRFLAAPYPRLRWTHLPAGTGLTARRAPSC